jgi:hypothetical protein
VRLLFVTAGLVLLGAAAVPAALGDNGGFTPVAPASPNAEGIRDSYLFVSIFVLAIFVLVDAASDLVSRTALRSTARRGSRCCGRRSRS